MLKKTCIGAVLVSAAMSINSANAYMVMEISNGASAVYITDNNGVAPGYVPTGAMMSDIHPSTGLMSVMGFPFVVGNYEISLNATGSSNRAVASQSGFMDLSSMSVLKSAAGVAAAGALGDLVISLTDTDWYSPTGGTISTHVGGSWAAKGATISADRYVDDAPGNGYFALTTHTGHVDYTALSSLAYAVNDSSGASMMTPYSMTLVARVNHTAVVGNGLTHLTASVTVPEPQVIVIFGAGLLLAGVAASRRRKLTVRPSTAA